MCLRDLHSHLEIKSTPIIIRILVLDNTSIQSKIEGMDTQCDPVQLMKKIVKVNINWDFIDNKELKFVPSPFDYNVRTDKAGVATVSKFRTVTMGNTLQSRNSRFQNPSCKFK